MFTEREIILFFAGVEAFHTVSHIALYLFLKFPVQLPFMTFTSAFNKGAIFINALATAALLWWASTL